MAPVSAPTILVVEDDPALRRTALRVFQGKLGYQVILAERAEEALARIDLGQHVDLVLSDLNLPDMTGSPSTPSSASGALRPVRAHQRRRIDELTLAIWKVLGER